MGQIMMKKNYILPLCLLCVCGVSACTSTADEEQAAAMIIGDAPYIDATDNPRNRCGVDGINCNDSALINYTRTEADYRAYGERTKRDHLYTQAGAGSNLVASIPPAIEEDVVVAPIVKPNYTYPTQTDVFAQTDAPSIEAPLPMAPAGNVGQSSTVRPTQEEPQYRVVCEEQCDNEDYLTEISGDSFDIADFVDPEEAKVVAEEDISDIEFIEVGKAPKVINAQTDFASINDMDILTWEAEEGDTLRDLLTKWSTLAGWKLLWQTNRNYTLNAGVMFKGKFADVSSALVRAFARARPAPIATFYKGNRVIVVETMENENAY